MYTTSQDHLRMDTVYQESPNTLTEGAAYVYPILGSSQDGYSILGIPEYSDRGSSLCLPHPRNIPGWIQYTRNLRILRQRGQLTCMSTPSQDHPGMDTGYQESPNTLTEEAAYVYPILGSSRDGYSIIGIPEYSDRGGSLCLPPSQDHPRIDTAYQESPNTSCVMGLAVYANTTTSSQDGSPYRDLPRMAYTVPIIHTLNGY